jgi:hypothetical protein
MFGMGEGCLEFAAEDLVQILNHVHFGDDREHFDIPYLELMDDRRRALSAAEDEVSTKLAVVLASCIGATIGSVSGGMPGYT